MLSNYKLQSSSGKQIEGINHVHKVCLMYEVITSARKTDVLSIGFDRDRRRRKRELTNNKNIKGKNHVTNMLKDILVLLNTKKKVHTISATN